MIASLMATVVASAGLGGQTPPVPAPMNVEIPAVAGATADPTCGGRPGMTSLATCVSTTQAGAQGLMDAYDVAFASQGWLAANGTDNRVIYVKRKPEGGCDAFQVLAFAAENAVAAPEAPAYIAFAAIPGDICVAQAPAVPAQ